MIHRGKPWRSVADVELATAQWVAWYNQERLHEALGYVPPAEYEAALMRLVESPQVCSSKFLTCGALSA